MIVKSTKENLITVGIEEIITDKALIKEVQLNKAKAVKAICDDIIDESILEVELAREEYFAKIRQQEEIINTRKRANAQLVMIDK